MGRKGNGKNGIGEEWEMGRMARMGNGKWEDGHWDDGMNRGWEEWEMGRMGRLGHAKNGKWDEAEEWKE